MSGLVVLVAAALVLAPVSEPALAGTPRGLVSLWSGDGDALDSADGNNGTLVGGVTFAPGVRKSAFNFNGVDGHVRVPSAANLNPSGSFSIIAWIFPTLDGFAHIVSKWGDNGDWGNQRSYAVVTEPDGGIAFGISDAAHQPDSEFHRFTSPSGVITINRWNHVTAVYDQPAGTRRLYLNGVLVAQRTDTPITVLAGYADLVIGGTLQSSTSFAYPFAGLIDEVGLFNSALTARQIKKLAHH